MRPPNPRPELLRLKDASEFLGIGLRSLQRQIANGTLPPPIQLGPRTKRYSRRTLLHWIDQLTEGRK